MTEVSSCRSIGMKCVSRCLPFRCTGLFNPVSTRVVPGDPQTIRATFVAAGSGVIVRAVPRLSNRNEGLHENENEREIDRYRLVGRGFVQRGRQRVRGGGRDVRARKPESCRWRDHRRRFVGGRGNRRHRGGMGNAIVSVGSPTNAGGIAIGAAGSAAGSAAINLGNGLLEPVAGVAGSVTGTRRDWWRRWRQAASGCARYGHRCAGRRGR